MGIELQVSNYKKFKLDIFNGTPMWSCVNYIDITYANYIYNTWAPFHAFLWFLIGSFCYESYSWWSKWQGIWFRVMPVNCGASGLCWPTTYTQTCTYDTLHVNIYCKIVELSWRQLTGSEGPTNSLNLTGASGALISMAKHGPQHSSSTILWKETRDQLCSKPRSA